MQQLIHHWYWARAQAGGYCVIASDITAERKYGHTEVPICQVTPRGSVSAAPQREPEHDQRPLARRAAHLQ